MNNNLDNNPNGKRPDNRDPRKQGPNKNHQSILAFLICLLVTLVCLSLFTNMLQDHSSEIIGDELLARLRAMTRKHVGQRTNTLTVGDLTLDTAQRRVTRGGEEIALLRRLVEKA